TLREGNGGALRFHGYGGSVVLRDVTVQQFTAERGAGAFVSGPALTVTDSVFDHNLANGLTSGTGGAVECYECTLDVSQTTFSDNVAAVGGGAVLVRGYATPTIAGSTFLRNTAPEGGAVYATEARLRVNGGTFSGNTANYGGAFCLGPENSQTWIEEAVIADNVAALEGGGIYQYAEETAVLVARCRVSGNSALRGGGILQDGGYLTVSQSGIVNNVSSGTASGDGGAGLYGRQTAPAEGRVRIVNSTLSGNVAKRGGGGLYVAEDATAYLTSSTITDNTANDTQVSSYGGGLWVHDTATCSVGNTIIAGNEMIAPSAGGPYLYVPDVRGDIVSRGHNLIGIWSDLYTIGGEMTGDQVGSRTTPLDSGLDVLRLVDGCVFPKIGSVPYHPVLPVSRAVNTADPAGIFMGPPDFSTVLTVDQCGNPRIQQGRGDIGAIESPYTRAWWPYALYLPAVVR
ncbi:MAG: right-handed parallel beta-helix repeat-containing protein, partial [Chloroflexi bacterium]|nr:right-handed parallel beta-helix repeat-containing protein [Chloroflexota bacterium]